MMGSIKFKYELPQCTVISSLQKSISSSTDKYQINTIMIQNLQHLLIFTWHLLQIILQNTDVFYRYS